MAIGRTSLDKNRRHIANKKDTDESVSFPTKWDYLVVFLAAGFLAAAGFFAGALVVAVFTAAAGFII